MTGDASVDGGRCCVANVRLAGGGRDQFGGSESGASSAGGDIERSRFEVLISANVPRLEFSIRSFPVPKSAVFRNEPFLFRAFVWRMALASARSLSGASASAGVWVGVEMSSLELMKGRREPERLRR